MRKARAPLTLSKHKTWLRTTSDRGSEIPESSYGTETDAARAAQSGRVRTSPTGSAGCRFTCGRFQLQFRSTGTGASCRVHLKLRHGVTVIRNPPPASRQGGCGLNLRLSLGHHDRSWVPWPPGRGKPVPPGRGTGTVAEARAGRLGAGPGNLKLRALAAGAGPARKGPLAGSPSLPVGAPPATLRVRLGALRALCSQRHRACNLTHNGPVFATSNWRIQAPACLEHPGKTTRTADHTACNTPQQPRGRRHVLNRSLSCAVRPVVRIAYGKSCRTASTQSTHVSTTRGTSEGLVVQRCAWPTGSPAALRRSAAHPPTRRRCAGRCTRGDCATKSAAAVPSGVLAAYGPVTACPQRRGHCGSAVHSAPERDNKQNHNPHRRARWHRAASGCNGP
jgi:hypothetical protein